MPLEKLNYNASLLNARTQCESVVRLLKHHQYSSHKKCEMMKNDVLIDPLFGSSLICVTRRSINPS